MVILYGISFQIPPILEVPSTSQKMIREKLKKYLSQYLRLSTLSHLRLPNLLLKRYLKILSEDDEKINISFPVRLWIWKLVNRLLDINDQIDYTDIEESDLLITKE